MSQLQAIATLLLSCTIYKIKWLMIATLCLYGLVLVLESVSVTTLYLILIVLENSGNGLTLVIWSPAFQLVQQSQDLQYSICTYEMSNTHMYVLYNRNWLPHLLKVHQSVFTSAYFWKLHTYIRYPWVLRWFLNDSILPGQADS